MATRALYPVTLIRSLENKSRSSIRRSTTLAVNEVRFSVSSNGASPTQQDLAEKLAPHFQSQTPVVFKDFTPISKSDAVYCWKSLDYLRLAVGENVMCSVEMGGVYSDPAVEKTEICFGDYLDYVRYFEERYGRTGTHEIEGSSPQAMGNRMQPNKEELIYLAQNDLFMGLSNDFPLPVFCQDPSLKVGEGNLYSVMIWFGPHGCVTPLHYDPLDNMLMQFVGRKRVLLFPPSRKGTEAEDNDNDGRRTQLDKDQQINWHYAGYSGQQKNTSPVDVEQPDFNRFPLFTYAPTPLQCVLQPGDMLYLPSKWWHHMRSLDTSVSVNVWWR